MWLPITNKANHVTTGVNLEQVSTVEFSRGVASLVLPGPVTIKTREVAEVAALRLWVEEHHYKGCSKG